MAVTSGTVHSVDTLISESVSGLQVARVLFTMSGTYAQADNSILSDVDDLINNSRRNGKTVTLVDTMGATPATKESGGTIMGVANAAVSGANITFNLTDGDYTTELANGAIPAHARPFSLLVSFTEA
jgi:hypothetical protein